MKACDNPFPHTWDWNPETSVSPHQSACKYLQNPQAGLTPASPAFQTHRGINNNNNNNINTKNAKTAKSSGLT